MTEQPPVGTGQPPVGAGQSPVDTGRPHAGTQLHADCANCFALCCVMLRFDESADFAMSKPAGTPCANLATDMSCTIHSQLRERGFPGCVAYDCQGAGQKVSQVSFGGRHWRDDAHTARWMVVVYPVVRQLHEMLAFLDEAMALTRGALLEELQQAFQEIDQLTYQVPEELLRVDVPACRSRVSRLLTAVSERLRQPLGAARRDADLIGARLRGADLRRADLRNARLIGADLRGADLRGADLLGADLRDADVRGAKLTDCLFVSQS
ncbi:MAG TPA: pentapeptide repeat-containing protein, partial [Jatrophihabitans sp.]|nr:pentapeptide repeat-containing protein [Jatrophihabitans sp.]